MKIHDSTPSPTPSMEASDSGNSSQCLGEFSSAGESSPVAYAARENPILASLLQPAHGGSDVVQWVYHSPYDSYSGPAAGPHQEEKKWEYSYDSRHLSRCNWEELHQTGKRIVRESSSQPLRHAIDVILGLKEVASPQNWTSHTELQSGGGFIESSNESDCSSSMGAKRNWHETDLGNQSRASTGDITSLSDHQDEDVQYVPKKLRMSRRPYVPKKLRMSQRYQSTV